VRTYGAVANDTAAGVRTANVTAINAAIAAAAGKTVYFPTGTWYVDSTINVLVIGVILKGDGPHATKISSNDADADMISIGNGTDYIYTITIKDMTLTKSVQGTTPGVGIRSRYAGTVTIDNVLIYGAASNSLYGGIYIDRGYYIYIIDSYIQRTEADGITIVGTSGSILSQAEIVETIIDQPIGAGIAVYDYTQGIRIHGTTVQSGESYGIYINPSSYHAESDILIDGCFIDLCADEAILIQNYANVNISNCIIDGPKVGTSTHAIDIGSAVDGFLIASNRVNFFLSGTSETVVACNGYHGVITGNSVNGAGTTGYGIYLGDPYGGLGGVCVANLTYQVGTGVYNAGAGDWTVEHNMDM
jgi:hypothetical protein